MVILAYLLCCIVCCAASTLWYVDLISGLSSYENQLPFDWLIVELFSLCVVKIGFWSITSWPWFVAYSIPLGLSNSGQVFQFWQYVSLDECSWGHGALHPEAELLHIACADVGHIPQNLSPYKPDDELGFCCFVNPLLSVTIQHSVHPKGSNFYQTIHILGVVKHCTVLFLPVLVIWYPCSPRSKSLSLNIE